MAERLDLGDLIYRLGFESEDDFLRQLDILFRDAESKANRAGNETGKAFGDGLSGSVKNFRNDFAQSLGLQTLGSFLGNTLANAFGQGLQVTRQFVQDSNSEFKTYRLSLNQAAAGGVQDLGKLQTEIKQLSEDSKAFSETQIASAVGQLVAQGYQAEAAFKLVRDGVNLARASIDPLTGELGNLTESGVKLSNVLEGFGLDLNQSARAADVLAAAAQASGLNVNELVGIVSEVGPIAKPAGVSLEEIAAAAGKLSQTGRAAGEIATIMRSAIAALTGPPKQVAKSFDDLGISLVDSTGKTRPFLEVLDNLERITNAGGRGVKFLNDSLDVFQAAGLAALGGVSKGVRDLSGDLADAEGSSKRLADGLNAGVEGTQNYERQLANLRRELGENLQPIMVDYYQTIAPELVKALDGLTKAVGRVIEAFKGAKTSAEQWADTYKLTLTASQQAQVQALMVERQTIEGQLKILNRPQSGLAGVLFQPLSEAEKKQKAELEARLKQIPLELVGIQKQATATQKALTAATTPAPKPTTQATSTASIPVSTGVTRQKDALVEAAAALDKELRLVEMRMENKRLGVPEFRAELERLEDAFTRLGNSAKTVDQRIAVEDGLSQIRQAREALDREAKQSAEEQKRKAEQAFRELVDEQKRRLRILSEGLEDAGGLEKLLGNPEELAKYKSRLAGVEAALESLLTKATAPAQRDLINNLLRDVVEARRSIAETQNELSKEAKQKDDKARLAQIEANDKLAEALLARWRNLAELENAERAARLGRLQTSLAEELALYESWADEVQKARIKAEQDRVGRIPQTILQALGISDPFGAELQDLYTARDTLAQMGYEGSEAYQRVQDAIEATLEATNSLDDATKEFWEDTKQASTDAATAQAAYDKARLEALANANALLAEGAAEAVPDSAVLDELARSIRTLQADFGDGIGGIGSTAFGEELERLKGLVQAVADDAKATGDIELFDRAIGQAEQLQALLDGLRTKVADVGADSERGGSIPFFDEMAALEAQIDIVASKLEGLPDVLLEQDGPLVDLINQMAGDQIDQLDTAIADLAPDDPALARLTAMRDRLVEIRATLSAIATVGGTGTLLGDSSGKADNAVSDTRVLDAFEKDFSNMLKASARDFIDELTDGTPDLAAAFRKVLGNGADFFLERMLAGIIGPIADEAAKALAPMLTTVAGTLGPAGLLVGGALLVGSLLLGASQTQSNPASAGAAAAAAARTPNEINYNFSSTVQVALEGSLNDPATRASMRQLAEEVYGYMRRRETGGDS